MITREISTHKLTEDDAKKIVTRLRALYDDKEIELIVKEIENAKRQCIIERMNDSVK